MWVLRDILCRAAVLLVLTVGVWMGAVPLAGLDEPRHDALHVQTGLTDCGGRSVEADPMAGGACLQCLLCSAIRSEAEPVTTYRWDVSLPNVIPTSARRSGTVLGFDPPPPRL